MICWQDDSERDGRLYGHHKAKRCEVCVYVKLYVIRKGCTYMFITYTLTDLILWICEIVYYKNW